MRHRLPESKIGAAAEPDPELRMAALELLIWCHHDQGDAAVPV